MTMRIFLFSIFVSILSTYSLSVFADDSDYWYMDDTPTVKPKKSKSVSEFDNLDDLPSFEKRKRDDYALTSPEREILKLPPSYSRPYKKVNARRAGPSVESITASYQKLDIESIWVEATGGLNDKGKSLLKYIQTVGKHGLKPAEYYLSKINQALTSGEEIDKLMSRVFIKLVNHATLGRLIPKKADTDWYIVQSGIDQDAALKRVLDTYDVVSYIESLFPQTRQYKSQLRAYEKIDTQVQRGGWTEFPVAGPRLQQGSRHAHVSLLRQRLRDSGYGGGFEGNVFGALLKAALIRFQGDHGLNADGVLGRLTRLTLAKSAEQRKKQIETTLERLRWLPKHMGNRYIVVNTAGYELNVIENDRSTLQMRIVVGKKRRSNSNHETPSFSRQMRYVVLNPKWYVPASIASKELLVLAQKDPNYFKRNGYRVYDSKGMVNSSLVNWNNYVRGEKLPLQIVQNSGRDNALGKMKFMLPNKYNIYLHDTPQKWLFSRDRRTFSHGCVRLSDPMSLATKVLGKTKNEISKMISSGRNRKVNLEQNIPVYVVYLTTWVRDDGTVIFFDDYYDRDSRMQHNFS